MKKLLKYYFEEYRNVLGNLYEEYNNGIDKARNKRVAHFDICSANDKKYQSLQNEYIPYGWQMYNDVKKMIDINKDLTIDEAIIEYTKSDTDKLRKEKIKKVATIRAYSKYFDVIKETSSAYINHDTNKYFSNSEAEESQSENDNKASALTSQQVLAMHYIFELLNVSDDRTLSAKAELIEMLTNKNIDSIKKALRNPLENKGLKGQNEDLEFVKQFFVKLKMPEIVNKINKDLSSTTSK